MKVLVSGVWVEWSAGTAEILPYDPAWPYEGYGRVGYNKGCPDGYVAQFVGEGADLAPIRCRRADEFYMNNPVIRNAETGITAQEQVNVITGAIGDTAKQIEKAIEGGAGKFAETVTSPGKWIVVGLVALAAILLMRN